MIKGLGWPIEKYGLTGRWMGRLDSESVAFRELPVSLPLRRLGTSQWNFNGAFGVSPNGPP